MMKTRWIVVRHNFGDAGDPDVFILDAIEAEVDQFMEDIEGNMSTCFAVQWNTILKSLNLQSLRSKGSKPS